ncbi:DUF4376 domain-containing protein [Salmonella enterica]|nr:DUF4376 domain-containing protein [Salmonella enterica]EMD3628167.1 DUF4376 domain-containing protein [Salmonella enterica]EMD3712069.1 DUF4376 domain-containing protein [Salmonella enterica]EMD3766148.1 DUF4376 domain-containing protein [Salmonella enterica]EMD4085638.1 DUF4376 domain-containing protein [Salmonella enterica]
MTVITDVKNARYNADNSVTADVRFDDGVNADGTPLYFPYTAAAHDPADYGKQLYADLVAGKYGQVTPFTFTVTPEMIQAARNAKHAEINAWRDSQEDGNIIFTLNNHRWDCGKASQARLAPVVAVAKSGTLPPGFFWTDADNNDVPVTTDELTALEAAMQQNMVLQGFKIHERQRQMKEEVDKLTDYKAIRDYAVGWPPDTNTDSATTATAGA